MAPQLGGAEFATDGLDEVSARWRVSLDRLSVRGC
jgi:hypothetical protein